MLSAIGLERKPLFGKDSPMEKEETLGQLWNGTDRLPAELAARLTPPLEHALNHPLRREILRALNRTGQPHDAAELVAESRHATNVTLVNYHAAVLERCDLLRVVEREVAGEGFGRRYVSNVTEDVPVLTVLTASDMLDRLND
jgi:DNA-binding transcriptional ArsR family regulator